MSERLIGYLYSRLGRQASMLSREPEIQLSSSSQNQRPSELPIGSVNRVKLRLHVCANKNTAFHLNRVQTRSPHLDSS